SMSQNAGEVLGRVPGTLEEGYAIVDASDAQRHRDLMEATIAHGHPLKDEVRVAGPDGDGRWLEVRGQLVRGPGGHASSVAGVCFDITERKATELALQLADRRKDEFLAMLAHELRNPLAPIRSASELLLRLGHADDRTRMAVGIVNRQALQLTRLVDDLLDVSRITRGRIELERKVLDLATVVAPALEAVDGLMAERKHRVTLVPSLEPLSVLGDAARLQQCVVNLLTNAAKYTDPGGQLELRTRREGDEAVLTVTDNGVGIAKDLLPAVFDLFVQSERTLDRSLGGLGIGLSVVKGLVELHGGSVVARSNGLGTGASFEVRLPVTMHGQASGTDERPATATGRKVLVVDDNRDAADSLALMLSFDDHDVRTVFGPEEALTVAAEWLPEIVLLDIGLPGMDGYEVARRLRASPKTARTQLVALTGYGQPEDRRKAIEAGFDDHLVKPASAQDLIRVLGPSTG
ncbi:MAG: ATP-binding protein, partial [Rhizobacter sp.]